MLPDASHFYDYMYILNVGCIPVCFVALRLQVGRITTHCSMQLLMRHLSKDAGTKRLANILKLSTVQRCLREARQSLKVLTRTRLNSADLAHHNSRTSQVPGRILSEQLKFDE
jgi:hypothetical protein